MLRVVYTIYMNIYQYILEVDGLYIPVRWCMHEYINTEYMSAYLISFGGRLRDGR